MIFEKFFFLFLSILYGTMILANLIRPNYFTVYRLVYRGNELLRVLLPPLSAIIFALGTTGFIMMQWCM